MGLSGVAMTNAQVSVNLSVLRADGTTWPTTSGWNITINTTGSSSDLSALYKAGSGVDFVVGDKVTVTRYYLAGANSSSYNLSLTPSSRILTTSANNFSLNVSAAQVTPPPPPPPTLNVSWSPGTVQNGQVHTLSISGASAGASVGIKINQLDAAGNFVMPTTSLQTIGSVDSNGSFTYSEAASWTTGATYGYVYTYINGTQVSSDYVDSGYPNGAP